MKLAYDPGAPDFWHQVSGLEGFPQGQIIRLSQMIFESDALHHLPRLFGQFAPREILIVQDPTPMRRGAQSLKPLVQGLLTEAGFGVEVLILEPDATGGVHTDIAQIGGVQARLRPGLSVLGLGSGCIADIAKHACHLYTQSGGDDPPLVLFQTANSVSAYTSNMAPTFVEGVKRTLPSRYPDVLVCDLETLRDAPYPMTAAGVGDLLAMFVSLPDWYLAHHLGLDDSYSPLPQALMGDLEALFLHHAEAIRGRSLDGMAVLAKLIALGGLAMSLSQATTPMSGYEHLISHLLDLQAELTHRPLAQHGAQVALATLLGAEAYRQFLQGFDPAKVRLEDCYPIPEAMHKLIETRFAPIDPSGKAAAECWSDYRQKLEGWWRNQACFADFLADWPRHRTMLQRLYRPPQQVRAIMRAVRLPLTFAELVPPISLDEARFAHRNAPLMRKRLTLGDLLLFLGWDTQPVWEATFPPSHPTLLSPPATG